jgi:hypothetical protein
MHEMEERHERAIVGHRFGEFCVEPCLPGVAQRAGEFDEVGRQGDDAALGRRYGGIPAWAPKPFDGQLQRMELSQRPAGVAGRAPAFQHGQPRSPHAPADTIDQGVKGVWNVGSVCLIHAREQ